MRFYLILRIKWQTKGIQKKAMIVANTYPPLYKDMPIIMGGPQTGTPKTIIRSVTVIISHNFPLNFANLSIISILFNSLFHQIVPR